MITDKHPGRENPAMLIPKTILYSTLKEAISTGSEEKIRDLSDILYGPFEMNMIIDSRVDAQHGEILQAIESMKDGFRQIDKRFELVEKRFEETDKRFDDLIHQMDKRFEQTNKRFDDLIHQMDSRFDDLLHQMDSRFEGNDRRFVDMNTRFEDMNNRFQDMNTRFGDINNRFGDMNRRFTFQSWLIGIGFVSINTLVVMLKIFG